MDFTHITIYVLNKTSPFIQHKLVEHAREGARQLLVFSTNLGFSSVKLERVDFATILKKKTNVMERLELYEDIFFSTRSLRLFFNGSTKSSLPVQLLFKKTSSPKQGIIWASWWF